MFASKLILLMMLNLVIIYVFASSSQKLREIKSLRQMCVNAIVKERIDCKGILMPKNLQGDIYCADETYRNNIQNSHERMMGAIDAYDLYEYKKNSVHLYVRDYILNPDETNQQPTCMQESLGRIAQASSPRCLVWGCMLGTMLSCTFLFCSLGWALPDLPDASRGVLLLAGSSSYVMPFIAPCCVKRIYKQCIPDVPPLVPVMQLDDDDLQDSVNESTPLCSSSVR